MEFSQYPWTEHSLSGSSGTIRFRAWTDIPYVRKPVAPELQRLHIFIPAEYFSGGCVNGYTAKTAPIFFPNAIGGYMEAHPCRPEAGENGAFNTAAAALARGYVVLSPGARGRTTQINGRYVGKAPAAIVDLKAAVRFIRSISKYICGDTNKIISNGTSAGGALSALLGASGDSPLYQPFLDAIGAEKESDRIFAASCYCPITNLENSDTAYEWQFGHLSTQHSMRWEQREGKWLGTQVIRELSDSQMELSRKLAEAFPAYINRLRPSGLSLNADGTGSFLEYIKSLILKSAALARKQGIRIPGESGVDLDGMQVDFPKYCGYITRMKEPCAFDNPAMTTPENELFGSERESLRHFTAFGAAHSLSNGAIALEEQVSLMNAMNFVGSNGCATHWRIRHGASDRDTAFAISACLAQCLLQCGMDVDYCLPWGVPHSGDYDLDMLFDWIDDLSRAK